MLSDIVIFGCERSGFRVLRSILNSSGKINLFKDDLSSMYFGGQQNTRKTDQLLYCAGLSPNIILSLRTKLFVGLNKLRTDFSQAKFVWLVRNPVDCVCSISKHFNLSTDKAFETWYVGNVIMWYFYSCLPEEKKFLIRYEEIVLNKTPMSNLFKFLNIQFDKRFLRYNDFDQFDEMSDLDRENIGKYKASDFPGLLDLWTMYRNTPLIIDLKYLNAGVE